MSASDVIIARWRRPAGPPEDSVAMRVVVAAAVEIAILAVVAQGGVNGSAAVLPLMMAPAGYLFSHKQRYHSNITTKVLLSVGLLAAFVAFLQSVKLAGSVDQARVPLASLFLWVQVLHAFDVPRRRDLSFSMISSVILMAEAGALSLSSSFALFVLPWAILAGGWLFLSSRPRAGTMSEPVAVRRRSPAHGGLAAPLRSAVWAGSAVLLASAVVFMGIPRLPGTLVRSLPFSLGGPAANVADFAGGVENPSLPSQGGDGVVDFAPNAYPGFSDVVDLRARGHLSDQVAFRVRAPQAALWRAEGFDTFDGTQWTISDRTTESLVTQWGDGPNAVVLPSDLSGMIGPVPTVHVTQTFYIDTPQPNVLFAAAVPEQIYFPSGGLKVDHFGSIRSPVLLDSGLIYSVVSEIPVTDGRTLRLANPQELSSVDPAYLQLPSELPDRVGELARSVTAGLTNEYDRVQALQSWIHRNTTYDLNVPRDPAGVDAVDHFLFVTRTGFCEQIASSLAIMLRTIGIPTRLVTGYGPGERNPLTGYFEVRQSDAHAWVEVYYPGIGWVPYDPTFGVPEAAPHPSSRFIGGEVLAAVGRFLSTAVPEPVKELFRNTGHGIGIVLGGLHGVRSLPVLGVLGLPLWALVVRRRRGSRLPTQPVALRAYLDLTQALASLGHPLTEQATPREYLRRVSADPAIERAVVAEAEVVVATLERDRFSGRPAADADLARSRAAVKRVRDLVARG
ncbi:MAG: transglutaminase TgpA family protein [Actinomycetota bacterium]